MSAVDKATQTQLTNIQTWTGKTLDELRAVLQQSGLVKHSHIRAMFQRDLGLGYGDANMLAQVLRNYVSCSIVAWRITKQHKRRCSALGGSRRIQLDQAVQVRYSVIRVNTR
jgi:hypothetical protein